MRGAHFVLYPLPAMFFAVLGIVFASVGDPSYKVIYNASASVPRGWYGVHPAHSLAVGMLVLVRLPEVARRIADERHYLPAIVPALKVIAAVPGDDVCEQDSVVTINGQFIARARTRDGSGRPLVSWSGCRVLESAELFLLNARNDASFDGRYFGPVDNSRVIGTAFPIWTW